MQERIEKLAKTIVNYSTEVKPGEFVFINAKGFETQVLAHAVYEETIRAGGVPYLYYDDDRAMRKFMIEGSEEHFKKLGEFMLEQMKQTQVFIGIRGSANVFEMSDVPKSKLVLYDKYIYRPVHIEQRVKHTRWCVMRYPNPAMCVLAQSSTEAFLKFYFDVCCLDYAQMAKAAQPLKELMDKTDKVRLVAPKTDLQFSIKDIPSVLCAGKHNIPDGECFSAPVKDSVNGTIRYNTPSIREGVLYEYAEISFKNGKAVEMNAGDKTDRLREVLTSDEGASYFGEFALGFNPYIQTPMKDTLFDEKIAGSLHMALGACYDDASNGNQSALHWDLVLIQRPEYGGGEIYFDDVLIRKDGLFVIPELEGLNAQRLQQPE